MELTYNKEQILSAYNQLPELVREAILQINMVATIQTIIKKHSLHIDQAGELSDEIGLVLVGLVPQTSFVQNIQRRLYLTSDQAREIAAAVNLEIFAPLQESIKKTSAEILTPPVAPPAPTPETPPAPANNTVFEQKMAGLFNLAKPWETDPYLEHPDK